MPNRLATLLAASALVLSAGAARAQPLQTPPAPPQSAPPAAPSPESAPQAAKDSRIDFLSDPITVQAKRETAKTRALILIHG